MSEKYSQYKHKSVDEPAPAGIAFTNIIKSVILESMLFQ